MTDALTAPVIGYRRWKVNAKGELEGYGVPVPWSPGVQTATCHGNQEYTVAEFCEPPAPPKREAFAQGGIFSFDWGYASGGPYRMPDGRWVELVRRKSCKDPRELPIDHPTPSLQSLCGIWAHKQPIPDCTCPEPNAPRHGAVGVVRMWGRGVEHADGWRAEHTEIVALVDHSNRVLQDYWVPRYKTTAEMYAEWAPDHHGWAARHDPCWCDHGQAIIHFGPGGQVSYTVPSTGFSQSMAQALTVQPYQWSGGWYSLGATTDGDEEDLDPKAKALKDRQTRNANHPGQDRPERSRRKRNRGSK